MKNANPLSWLFALGLFLASVSLVGCKDGGPEQVTEKPASTFFPIKLGTVEVSVQLAVSQAEMARGLMGRRDLGPEQGMLFVYDRPQRMSFWMQNTPTPLDIGYFDRTGTLREVYPMYPYDETSVASRGQDLMYALEVNQGWFSRHGIRAGARLDLIAVAKALRERGIAGRGIEEAEKGGAK